MRVEITVKVKTHLQVKQNSREIVGIKHEKNLEEYVDLWAGSTV